MYHLGEQDDSDGPYGADLFFNVIGQEWGGDSCSLFLFILTNVAETEPARSGDFCLVYGTI